MNNLQKPDDEHFFFRQEMRCKARLEALWDRWTIRLFGWVSDFGYSVARPLALLVVVIAMPLGAYISLLQAWTGAFDAGRFLVAFVKALGLSFANTFKFFGIQRLYFSNFFAENPYIFIDFVSGAQTVLGYTLLFFLGLGLRNRFRLK